MIQLQNINEIADTIISEIKSAESPFSQATVVCHNTKVAQWFKAYYLKHNSEVMMNVKFITLSVFINDIVNPNHEFKIMGREQFRAYIIKALTDSSLYSYDAANPTNPINYIFHSSGELNGMNLYEFADRLATLFINYECDLEIDDITGWEKDLYDKVIELAEADKCSTTKRLWEKRVSIKSPSNPAYVINNSYISNLFSRIIEKDGGENTNLFSIEDTSIEIPENTVITAAPSKVREVEALHTEICKLVRDNKDLRYNDFLVYAPNIKDYANSIRRVFMQDNKTYPDIPFRIVGECREQGDMIDSISLLIEIANKKFFTRNDFYRFVKNPMIMWIRDISEKEIDVWMNVIAETNVHRNGKVGKEKDDWKYLKNRLLLSKLVFESAELEFQTEIGGEGYLPHGEMGLDSESMNKFFDIIDSLQNWLAVFDGKDLTEINLDENYLCKIRDALDLLYSKVNSDLEETNYLYQRVSEELNQAIDMYENIPANTLMLLLQDAPLKYSVNLSDMFTGGVTFMSLNADDIVSAPYVFVLGMSSSEFPRVDVRSELDLSQKHKTSKELDETALADICKNAYVIAFSYINCNLKTEEEYYPCTYISGFKKEIINIDETRTYSELFTKREFKRKSYITNLGVACTTGSVTTTSSAQPVETITLSDIKNFYENTFVYKFEKSLRKSSDENEKLNDEYEPIEVGSIADYSNAKEVITTENSYGAEKRFLEKKNSLPPADMEDVYYAFLTAKAEGIRTELSLGYHKADLKPIKMENAAGVSWTLSNNNTFYIKEDGRDLYYIEPIVYPDADEAKPKQYFATYACALMDIAGRSDENKYTVHLIHLATYEKIFKITPAESKEILGRLYELMSDYSCLSYMDSYFLKNAMIDFRKYEKTFGEIPGPDNISSLPASIKEMKGKIDGEYSYGHNAWKYFSDKQLIDEDFLFGYSEANFRTEFFDYFMRIKQTIKFKFEGK